MASNTSGTTGTTGSSNPAAKDAASGVKGAFAAVHGAGEAIRGTVNGAIDETFDKGHGTAKDDLVTRAGVNEMETGKFSHSTKNREGAVPGADHQTRNI